MPTSWADQHPEAYKGCRTAVELLPCLTKNGRIHIDGAVMGRPKLIQYYLRTQCQQTVTEGQVSSLLRRLARDSNGPLRDMEYDTLENDNGAGQGRRQRRFSPAHATMFFGSAEKAQKILRTVDNAPFCPEEWLPTGVNTMPPQAAPAGQPFETQSATSSSSTQPHNPSTSSPLKRKAPHSEYEPQVRSFPPKPSIPMPEVFAPDHRGLFPTFPAEARSRTVKLPTPVIAELCESALYMLPLMGQHRFRIGRFEHPRNVLIAYYIRKVSGYSATLPEVHAALQTLWQKKKDTPLPQLHVRMHNPPRQQPERFTPAGAEAIFGSQAVPLMLENPSMAPIELLQHHHQQQRWHQERQQQHYAP